LFLLNDLSNKYFKFNPEFTIYYNLPSTACFEALKQRIIEQPNTEQQTPERNGLGTIHVGLVEHNEFPADGQCSNQFNIQSKCLDIL
jgi:hypothetical protein